MTQKYRIGECLRCGRCCQTKYIYGAMNIFAKINLRFKLWRNKQKFDINTQCQHLRFRRGKAICKHYKTRPAHCNKYPEDHKLIEGCGYRIINQKEYDAILKQQQIPHPQPVNCNCVILPNLKEKTENENTK